MFKCFQPGFVFFMPTARVSQMTVRVDAGPSMRWDYCGKVRVLEETVTALPEGPEVERNILLAPVWSSSASSVTSSLFPLAPSPRPGPHRAQTCTAIWETHLATDICSDLISNITCLELVS